MSDENEQLAEHWRKQYEQLQAKIQRLRNLQPSDITMEELEAVNDGWYPEFMGSGRIAAVCRGMLREVGGDG